MESPLLEAARVGDVASVTRCLQQQSRRTRTNVNCVGSHGNTPLMLAARACHNSVVMALLTAGARLNQTNDDGDTALIMASRRGHRTTVECLVARGAKIDLTNNIGDTAMSVAMHRNHTTVVKVLLDRQNATVTKDEQDQAVPVETIVAPAEPEIISQLRDWEGPVDAPFAAIARGDVEALRRIVDQQKNSRGSHDRTPLHVAAALARLDMVKLLVFRGADIHARDASGWTALHHASQGGDAAVVRFIVVQGCLLDVVDVDGCSAVMIAATHGYVDIVRDLKTLGANLNKVTLRGSTLLHVAAEHKTSAAVVDFLLSTSEDAAESVGSRDDAGATPLHYAVRAGNEQSVEALISHGADVNAQDKYGETSLIIASGGENVKIVEVLLSHGARTDVASHDGRTPLSVVQSAEVRSVLQLYHNSQLFHERCSVLLSDAGTTPSEADVKELIGLITSVYDLRLLLAVISLRYDSEINNDSTARGTTLKAVLDHIITNKLVFDDHACVFFKLVLDRCKTSAWLSAADIHLLDRQAEKVNTESAEWVVELQKKVHEHSWRLDAHEQSLRRVVDGIAQVHTMVLANRKAIKAVRTRISHIQSQVDTGKRLMSQLVSHSNQLSDHVHKLHKRLTHSENNIVTVARGLKNLRTSYVSRVGHDAKIKTIKMIGALLASVVGFVFAPVLKGAFDAVVDLANPVQIVQMAYQEKDLVHFLAETTTQHALIPSVENALARMMIPKDEFETLLREEIISQHPELLDECVSRGFVVETDGDISKAEYVDDLELTLATQASVMEGLLNELQAAAGDTTTRPTLAVKAEAFVPEQFNVTLPSTASSLVDNQLLEEDPSKPETSSLATKFGSQRREVEVHDGIKSSALRSSSRVEFRGTMDAFPYHSAVHESLGNLQSFRDLLDLIVGDSEDPTALMVMELHSMVTHREALCAIEYAYALGYQAIGDFFAARMKPNNQSVALNRTPAISVKLLESADDFAYICVVNETQGDVDECELLCEVFHEADHAVDARIQAEVVREQSETVAWSAVEYASHLGYVEVTKYLLKEKHRTMTAKDKIQLLRHAQQQQQNQ